MNIVSKDFCSFTGVFIAIYMGPCRRFYILLVQKFRTSEMLDKWSPTYKLSDVKLSHCPDGWYIFFTCMRTHLSAIPIKSVFWYPQIFSLVYYNWILSIRFHVSLADLGVSVRLSTFCIIFPTFLRTVISPDFTWIFIDWVFAGCIFSLA